MNYRVRKLLYKKLEKIKNLDTSGFLRILKHNILFDRINICNKLGIQDLDLNHIYFDELIERKIKNVGGEKINQDEGLNDDDMINGNFSYNIAVNFRINPI